ncbi:hypothetical protein F4693_002306 [Sphingomonas endophytica]|uniref:Uncharacterized protein n=1 Tax=Sphingomonas endophytica TaxID=869719 RepID=A0A7X0JCY1_9SPHN|nr:hypothetical protein [Sphingomonas endophytica]MBB6505318.1 hypothetical protein [Sphingomonas endophytica]
MVVRVVTRGLDVGSARAVAALTLLALGGAILVLRPDRVATDRSDVTVVAGGEVAATQMAGRSAAPAPAIAPVAAHRLRPPVVRTALAHAAADTRVMDQAAAMQPPDPRGTAIEQRVATAFRARAALADARDVVVTCTVTLCEVAGTTGADPATARSALRDDGLLRAMATLGYSSGPDEEAPGNGGTAFVMYLNREI